MKVHGRTNLYGYTIGILVNEAHFPRLPGALGNATTFPFPVLQKAVRGATSERVVRDPDRGVIEPYLEAARELEAEGVKAITTSCGFTAMFQREMAEAVNVPLFASSLLLAPMLARMIRSSELVGIVTADARHLTPRHFEGVGIDRSRVAVAGMEGCGEFEEVVFKGRHDLDVERLQAEVVDVTRRLLARHPNVRVLLLECSLLPPFARTVQQATGLPVFDFTTLVNMVHASLVRKPFEGYL
jgi:hypothetical protein